MRTDFDAVIVGAGPAGSSAAILLARAGWSVALIEKQVFPRRKVCGECVAASNLPLLEALGLGAAFAAAASPELKRVGLMHRERVVVAELPAAANEKYRWGRALGRETLDTMLLERARAVGALVLQPWSVQAIDGAAGDWHCRLRSAGSAATLTLRAPIAIAAHGSWQALPAARTRRRKLRAASDLFAFKANFRNTSLDAGLLPVLAFDGGYGGMVVADAGLTTLACCVRRDRLDTIRLQAPGLRAGEGVEALLRREVGGVRTALRSAARQGPWLAAGPIDPGIRLRDDGGLMRIGNAAGEAHPIIGEGMSMALQSAWLLCAQLLGAPSCGAREQRAVAHRYAAQWRQHFAARLRLAGVFAQIAMRPALAESLLSLTDAWPAVLTAGARWGGKVRCAIDVPGTEAGSGSVAPPLPGHPSISS